MSEPSLGPVDALVCDLDGVLYREDQPIAGAASAVAEARERELKIVFATNNATKTQRQYLQRLEEMGFEVSLDEIVTSAIVTSEEIVRRGWHHGSVFIVGSRGIREALRGTGIRTLAREGGDQADVVVVSSDPDFGYEDVRVAANAVRDGAHFVATNADPTFPAPDGLRPGAGAVLAAVETASGKRAEVMGKPHRPMMEAIQRRLDGCERIAVIGDQPGTDLAGGRAMGWTTILVLTGVTDAAAASELDPRPDLVLDSIAELGPLLKI